MRSDLDNDKVDGLPKAVPIIIIKFSNLEKD
jgi:hypothetical protein